MQRRVESLGRALELPAEPPALEEIRRVVTIFRELRDGKTSDGKTKLKQPTGTLSTAEAISVVNERPGAGRALWRRAAASRMMSPPAWSARWSKTRCRTGWSGWSIWKRW